MNLFAIIVIAVYAVIGGGATLILTLSLPGLIAWKFYRKVKYHKAWTD